MTHPTKHKCIKCLRWLDEDDLDRKNGEWICRECEEHYGGEK
jgi:uncharacterized protein YbaR (Trm112 family)